MPNLTRRDITAATLAILATGPALGRDHHGGAAWREAASLPARLQEIYPATMEGRIYLAGGFEARDGSSIDSVSDALYISDVGVTAWTRGAALPEPRHHPNLVAHGRALYALGGFRPTQTGPWGMLANNTRYQPDTDSWTELTPMPAPFGETCAVSLGDHIHIATGRMPNGEANAQWTDHGDRGDHFIYDPSDDRWRSAAPNPNPRNSAAGVVLDGRFHVIGGRRVNAGNNSEHEAYDPASDRWISLAPLPQGQGGLAAAVLEDKIYAFGGEWFADGGGVYPNCWVYDPRADRWSAGPDMRTPRHGLGGLTIGDGIYAIGGARLRGGDETSVLVEVLTL